MLNFRENFKIHFVYILIHELGKFFSVLTFTQRGFQDNIFTMEILSHNNFGLYSVHD